MKSLHKGLVYNFDEIEELKETLQEIEEVYQDNAGEEISADPWEHQSILKKITEKAA